MIVKTAELEGRALDYAVALCEGYRWAKNAVGRYGDGFRRAGEKPQYPIGSRLVVSPSRQKDLSKTTPNWDGWLISDMKEPIARRHLTTFRRFRPTGQTADRSSSGRSLAFRTKAETCGLRGYLMA